LFEKVQLKMVVDRVEEKFDQLDVATIKTEKRPNPPNGIVIEQIISETKAIYVNKELCEELQQTFTPTAKSTCDLHAHKKTH